MRRRTSSSLGRGVSVMADPDLPEPAYHIPLDDAQFATLGRISAIFAQMDEFLGIVIRRIYNLSPEQFKALLGEKMLSARISALEAAASRHPKATKSITEFVGFMRKVIPDRNLVMHGSWAQHTDDYITFRVGPYSSLKPNRRLYVDELQRIYSQACEASRMLVGIMVTLNLMTPADEGVTPTLTYTTADRPPHQGWWQKGSVVYRVEKPTQG